MWLPEEGRPDGDGWLVGCDELSCHEIHDHPRQPRPAARLPWRRLLLAVAILTAVVVLIAAATPAAHTAPPHPTGAVRCGDRPPITTTPGGPS